MPLYVFEFGWKIHVVSSVNVDDDCGIRTNQVTDFDFILNLSLGIPPVWLAGAALEFVVDFSGWMTRRESFGYQFGLRHTPFAYVAPRLDVACSRCSVDVNATLSCSLDVNQSICWFKPIVWAEVMKLSLHALLQGEWGSKDSIFFGRCAR